MNRDALLRIAEETGFTAAVCQTADIPVDPTFRKYCEENICGQYGKNYGCPPLCGTPKVMEELLRSYPRALVLQTAWNITDYTDHIAIAKAKTAHNAASAALLAKLKAEGEEGLIVGSSGCTVCEECALAQKKPCRFPEQQYACMSAYCVHVLELARLCQLRYDCDDGRLRLFGMLLLK